MTLYKARHRSTLHGEGGRESIVIRESPSSQDIRNRLLSAQGHMRTIEKMIADDAPCLAILQQLRAIRGAMRAFEREVWRAYLLDKRCGLRSTAEEQGMNAWGKVQAALRKGFEP